VIRILLAEDMKLLRKALATVLSREDDFEVVAELDRYDDVQAAAKAASPDVAVVDIEMPCLGLSDPAELRSRLPDCAVLVLAGLGPVGALRRVLDANVPGLIGKEAAPQQLVEAIRQVARGERVIDPVLAVRAVAGSGNPLTVRETEVLRIAAEGAPPGEIAGRLFLSERTVRNYLSTIQRKTGSRTRLEVVRKAEQAGWI